MKSPREIFSVGQKGVQDWALESSYIQKSGRRKTGKEIREAEACTVGGEERAVRVGEEVLSGREVTATWNIAMKSKKMKTKESPLEWHLVILTKHFTEMGTETRLEWTVKK